MGERRNTMIIEFRVRNWMSFKEESILNLLPGKVSEYPQNVTNTTPKVLKSAAFYGSNASGKSNFFKAIQYYRKFTIYSQQQQQSGDKTRRIPFKLDIADIASPTTLEMTFLTKNGQTYRYGYSLDDEKIYEEWLEFIKPTGKVISLLERDTSQDELFIDKKLLNSGMSADVIKLTVNENSLVLSFLNSIRSEIAHDIVDYMKQIIFLDNTNEIFMGKTERLEIIENDIYKQQLLNLLKAADLGIENIKARKRERYIQEEDNLPKEIREYIEAQDIELFVSHNLYRQGKQTGKLVEMPYEDFESQGTKKIVSLAHKIINAIKYGRVIVVDELDTQLHPLMLRAIVGIFNNELNANNAQLLFTTHDITLIDRAARLFRRDQIWFTDKKANDQSELFSLYDYKYSDDKTSKDFKSIRKDENFAKNYLKGKYQAVPIITDLMKHIEWEVDADE